MHEVLVNRLGGLSLPRKSVVRLTDRPNMTLDVYRGRKITMQQHQPLLDIFHQASIKHDARSGYEFCFKKNSAVVHVCALRSIYWLSKEKLPTLKHKSLLNLQRLQGCSFPESEFEVGSASYTSSHAAEEMQDAIASVLVVSMNNKLSSRPFISVLLDENCDISVTKKLLVFHPTLILKFIS